MIISTIIITYFIVSLLIIWFLGIIIWMYGEEYKDKNKLKK